MKRLLIFLFCLLAAFGPPSAQAMTNAELAQRINQAWRQKDYASLVPLCTVALQAKPRNPALIHGIRGLANYRLNHMSAALADTNEAVRLNPRLAFGYAIRADVYLDLGKLDSARRDADEAIRLDPAGRGGYRPRADLEYEERDYADALRDYNHVLIVNPDDAETHGARAGAYLAMHELKKAAADYRASLRLWPKDSLTYAGLAGIDEEEGRYDEAVEKLTKAISLDPKSIYLLKSRMHAYEAQGDLPRAVADAEQAAAMKPKRDYEWGSRAQANQFLGHYQRALLDVAQGRRQRPWAVGELNDEAYLLATCPEAALRNGKQAVIEATRACELSHWQNASGIDTLAAATAEVGNFAKAIEMEKRALRLPLSPYEHGVYAKHLERFEHHLPLRLVPKSPS